MGDYCRDCGEDYGDCKCEHSKPENIKFKLDEIYKINGVQLGYLLHADTKEEVREVIEMIVKKGGE